MEYYYDQLGRVTNITERIGDAASSTYTASVNPNGFGKRGKQYFAWLAPLSRLVGTSSTSSPTWLGTPEGKGIAAGFLLVALALGLLRRLAHGGKVGTSSTSSLKLLIGILRSLLPQHLQKVTTIPPMRDSSLGKRSWGRRGRRPYQHLLLPGLLWRYSTAILIVCLLGSDPKLDSG